MPHIIEKIFFSLDYASFKNCLEVNRTWNELLTTKRYKKRGKLEFTEELKEDERKLSYALFNGRIGEVRALLSSGMLDVDCEFQHRLAAPLQKVSMYGHIAIVQLLLNGGANPNKRDRFGVTPLHNASSMGHIKVVQILLERGANPNNRDRTGYTPLHCAARRGHTKVIRILLDGGAKPNKCGVTPMVVASANGHKDAEKVLMKWRGRF